MASSTISAPARETTQYLETAEWLGSSLLGTLYCNKSLWKAP